MDRALVTVGFTPRAINRKEPIPIYDHGLDCTRYIINSAYEIIKEQVVPVFEIIEEEGYWF